MLFRKTMCIICRGAVTDPVMRRGDVGLCADCAARLPYTGADMSFAALNNMEYIISPFYYRGDFRGAVLGYKFYGCYAYAGIFSELMRERFKNLPHLREFDALAPVPLSRRRMNERGYNQAAVLAEPLAEFIGAEYLPDALVRVRHTKRQSEMQNYKRVENVKDAFAASDDVAGKSVIVFDDICTTGYTLEECAGALKKAGAARVIGITLAIAYRKQLNHEAFIF